MDHLIVLCENEEINRVNKFFRRDRLKYAQLLVCNLRRQGSSIRALGYIVLKGEDTKTGEFS